MVSYSFALGLRGSIFQFRHNSPLTDCDFATKSQNNNNNNNRNNNKTWNQGRLATTEKSGFLEPQRKRKLSREILSKIAMFDVTEENR